MVNIKDEDSNLKEEDMVRAHTSVKLVKVKRGMYSWNQFCLGSTKEVLSFFLLQSEVFLTIHY